MPNYTVTWAINIDAGTPQEAAQSAYDIQQRPDSIATVFTVAADGQAVAVDLTMGDVTPVVEPETHLAQAMLQAAVDKWGKAVRNDEPINGGDAVQWLSSFIAAADPQPPKLGGPS